MNVLEQVKASVKDAMRAKDKARLGALRLITAEFKRVEVDERIEIDDARATAILDKMVKQRRDSISQYESADRHDLADVEKAEMAILSEFLPEPLSEDALNKLIADAIDSTNASSMQDMGSVMAVLKPQVQGRADMGSLSKQVRAALN